MKVSLVSAKDYCNIGYSLSLCLQKVGVEAESFVLESNLRRESGHVLSTLTENLKNFLDQSDTIIFMHSVYIPKIKIRGKRIFVFHGGSRYRKKFNEYNRFFNRFVEKSLIQTGDLLDLGARNEVWLQAPIDTESIKPVNKEITGKIIISHFPSGYWNPKIREIKGTGIIERAITNLKNDKTISDKFEYCFSPKKVLWEENLRRMSGCDIYLEACKPVLGRRKYGEFGIAGLEAAAMGKILVSHFLSSERYKQEFGEHAVQVINSPAEIEIVLRRLLAMSSSELRELQIKTREWVEKFHSFEVIGKRLKGILDV